MMDWKPSKRNINHGVSMTENDLKLIEIAKRSNWEFIVPMFDKTESEECKLKLQDILKAKYHQEEIYLGLG
jgi:hypothetical protein